MKSQIAFAEIMESSLHVATAQCWDLHNAPEFGTLVQIEDSPYTLFGIVNHIHTGSLDAARYPFPYKKTREELAREQPQIFEFLKTSFSMIMLGYQQKNSRMCYTIPPKPCAIHAFVAHSSEATRAEFFGTSDYLHVLFAHARNIEMVDELLLNILLRLHTHNQLTIRQLEEFCEAFALLSGNDYRRLKVFMLRVQRSLPALVHTQIATQLEAKATR